VVFPESRTKIKEAATVSTPFTLFKQARERPGAIVNLAQLGYRALYLHIGEKPVIVIFSLGFRSVVEVTKWVKEHMGYKIIWVNPTTTGFHYDARHDVVATDIGTLVQALELRQDKDNILGMITHMAAPHTAAWQIKKRIPTMRVVTFMYDIMSLWVKEKDLKIWDQYDDAKGSNPAEYTALKEIMRGEYIDGIVYKDWGPGWPLIAKAGLPCAWWPSSITETLYQKPPTTEPAWDSFAYIGTIMPKSTHDRPAGLFSDIMMEVIFREVALQGFPVHAYVMRPHEDVIKEYRGLFPGGSGVKMLSGDNLHHLLPRIQGRYKWGWMFYHYPEPSIMGLVANSLPTKLYTYMALCIPPVVSEEMEAVARFVREHKIGVVVTQEEIGRLHSVLDKVDYMQLVKNILRVRSRFSMEAVTPNLGNLLRTVMGNPRKPIPEKPVWLELNEQIETARQAEAKQKAEEGSDDPETAALSGWRNHDPFYIPRGEETVQGEPQGAETGEEPPDGGTEGEAGDAGIGTVPGNGVRSGPRDNRGGDGGTEGAGEGRGPDSAVHSEPSGTP